MATETATIEFDTTLLLLSPDSIAVFENFHSLGAEEGDNFHYAAAKKIVSDDDEDEDDEVEADEDDDLEEDEDEDVDEEDDDEFEDDDDDDDDDEEEDEDEDDEDEDDADELHVGGQRFQ